MSRALHASLNELTHGAAISRDSRRAQLAVDALQEMMFSFQLPVSGTATATPTFTEVEVTFDALFHDATEQRDSPFIEPNMTFGAVLDNPVILTACVKAWRRVPGRTSINGALVAVGAIGTNTAFKGDLHLCFQGYGATSDVVDLGT